MLTERHLENYADVLWWGLSTARRQRFRKNDVVQIRFHAGAVRLMEILYRYPHGRQSTAGPVKSNAGWTRCRSPGSGSNRTAPTWS